MRARFPRVHLLQNPQPTSPNSRTRALWSNANTHPQPKPVVFEDLNLLVKFGLHVTVAEAQYLWMIKRVFQDKAPVPEVLGWRVNEENDVFIYMELIRGQTLEARWNGLYSSEKTALSKQLCNIVRTVRQLEQGPADPFIGSITRQHLLDLVFRFQPESGPFTSIKAFNDWFSSLPQLHLPPELKYECPYRSSLPDTYWEYCTALYTCLYESSWREDWVDVFLEPRTDEYWIFSEYITAIRAF